MFIGTTLTNHMFTDRTQIPTQTCQPALYLPADKPKYHIILSVKASSYTDSNDTLISSL